jgi:predicted DNA-binding WGR domain protein
MEGPSGRGSYPFDSPLPVDFPARGEAKRAEAPQSLEALPRSKKRGFRRLWILTPSLLASDRQTGQHGEHMQTTHPEAAELVKLSPAQRQARFYRLEIWPDLFGGFSLAREYGRIGQPGRLQLDPFPALDPACKAFARIVRTKQRRGYVPCAQRF